MNRKLWIFSILTTVLFLCVSTVVNPIVTEATDAEPSVGFSVTPSASEYVLDQNNEARGLLDIEVTPSGASNTQTAREPIDVVFLHNTAGSMDANLNGQKKFVRAKNALLSAISYFEEKDKTEDNFHFVPFNSEVRNEEKIKEAKGFEEIKKVAKELDQAPNNKGNADYVKAFKHAQELLTQANNNHKKYIILLTDGKPYGTKDEDAALKASKELFKNKITMYSIGFTKKNADFIFLKDMSKNTGGYAVNGVTGNVTTVFEDILKKSASYTLRGEVTVPLIENVVVDSNANVAVDVDNNRVAHIPFAFNFPEGKQPDPSELVTSLPLIFKQAGTYTFNNIKLSSDRLPEQEHAPITVIVNEKLSFSWKLQILEVIDKGASKLSTSLQNENFEITTITMKQFVASREEFDGKYDIIAIPEGTYSTTGVQQKEHNTQDVLNDITNLKANEIINQFINKGQPVILEKNAIQNGDGAKLQTHFGQYTTTNKNVIVYDNKITNSKTVLLSSLTNFLGSKDYKPRPRFELTDQPSTSQVYKPGEDLEFTINMTTGISAKDLKAFLYIDSDSDDQYDSSEIILEKTITSATSTLSYKLPRGYSGVRDWKLEVVDMGTNLKDYQKGTSRFKDEKVVVNVLQIQKSASDPSSLKDSKNMNQSYLSTDEYQINIDVTNMTDFNNSSGPYSHTNINGKYDMLIFGFADMYNNTAINTNTVQSVENFIKTNQSILFTHDTIFNTDNNWVNNFMDDTGQKEPLTNLGYGAPNKSTTTKKVNEGLITTYPYDLADNITIAQTHNQYYTLDLEDPKVIPWYNITGNNRDPYDSWNHYYTYSKGNITYSGTGHTSTGFPKEEQKLFVNTMYRAFQGSNHAPVLTVLNPTEDEVIPAHHKIELAYTLQDFDLKDTKLSTKVFLDDKQVYTNNDVANGATIVQSLDHGMPNGGKVVLRIEATDSQGAKIEKTINLTIEKINADLEVSRHASTQDVIPVDSELTLTYEINPKKITGEAAQKITEDEKILSGLTYEETFPANVDLIIPEGFKKTGSLEEGYTVTGTLPDVLYKRVGDEFIAATILDPFKITVIPKKNSTLTLTEAQISYTDHTDTTNPNKSVQFNPITFQADYAVKSIELPENTVINQGIPKNLALDLIINPKEAGIKEIVWSVTEGQDIFTVDPITGVVTAKGEGSGKVTVTVTDLFGHTKTATTYVTVRVPVTSIDVTNLTLQVGDEKTLPITINPENAKNGVTIELADPSLASIDKANWKVIGLKPGKTIITVRGTNSAGELVEDQAELTIEQLVNTITVTPNPLKLKVGDTYSKFTVVVGPEDATNKEVVWKSLHPDIVSVSENGTITGLKKGTATVEISSKDGHASTTITVEVGSYLKEISLKSSEITVKKGDTGDVNKYLIYEPVDAINIKNKTFTSSNENIIEVNPDGTFTAKGVGTATITIKVYDEDGKEYTAILTVHVTSPLEVSASAITMNKGEKRVLDENDLTYNPSKPANIADYQFSYTSSNPNTVSVDANGLLTAKEVGTATISITLTDKAGEKYTTSLTVNVKSAAIPLERISAQAITIEKGDSINVDEYLKYIPSNSTNIGDKIFKSSDSNIVTVDVNGTLEGQRIGEATIFITVFDTDGNKYTTELKVTVVPKGSKDSGNGNDKY